MIRKSILFAAVISPGIAAAADGPSVAFVACPIVRDTRSVPCWLSEYDGELYYLGIQTDVSAEFHPPSLGHQVLVEGAVSDEPRICGGRVLKPVTVSVMQERADNCQTLLMAEDRYELPFEAPRPPGPSRGRLAFGDPPAPEVPQPPFQARTFEVPYDFNGTVGFKHPAFLIPVLDYARQTAARQVTITGYRAAVRLSNGELLVEQEPIAQRRAAEVAELLTGAGLTSPEYALEWKSQPEIGGPDKRRVTVTVTP